MSAQGQPAPDIAHLLKTSEAYVRDLIHAFNERLQRRGWWTGPGSDRPWHRISIAAARAGHCPTGTGGRWARRDGDRSGGGPVCPGGFGSS
ncbi:hypothetical protein [Micromonospora sp. NPDC002717]|uniref:hypothetical protein n=1 Tax=Micromonospora sp. NPDC002717 TaxID=3154424 RepID=UPI003321FC5D